MAHDLLLSEDITCLQVLEAHSSDVTSCDFGNNAMLATGSGDRTARLWLWSAADDCFVEAPCSPLEGHKYGVTCVSFSPQGTMLATGSVDGTTILWNVASGARIHTFVPATGGAVRAVRFSPDSGAVLTVGDSGSLCVWDLLRRSLSRCIWAHEGAVHALAPTPDGRLLVSGCSNGALRVWALAEAAASGDDPPLHLPAPPSPRAGAAVLSGASGPLEAPLAQVEDAHDLGILAGDVSPLQALEDADFEEDVWERSVKGRRLRHRYLAATGGNDNAVRLWDVRSPACDGGCAGALRATIVPAEPRHALLGHGSAVTAIRFARAGALVLSAGLDKTARVWHVASGSCVSVVSGHDRFVFAVAASRCGSLLATGSYDQCVRVWSLAGDRRPPPPAPAAAAASRRAAAAAAAAGANGQERAVLKHAEVEGGVAPSLLQRLAPADGGAINGVAFALGGQLLAAAHGDKLVRVWARDVATGRFSEAPCSPLEGHRYSVLAAEFSPDPSARLASCSLDGEALLWDVQAGERAGSPLLCVGGGALRALRFSPDGHLLATAGDDERVCVWALASGELLLSAEGHTDAVSGLAVSPDSQLLASCSADESVRLWALAPPSENCLLALEAAHDLGAASVDFSPSEGLPGHRPRHHGGPDVEKDDDHRYLLASGGNDGHVRLWRVHVHYEDGALAVDCARAWRVLVGHAGSITCVRFCPGAGDLLASAAIDRSARVWSVYSGDCLHVLEGHYSLLTAVAFSSDCSLLATGSLDKSVLVWELPAHLVFQAAGSDRLCANTKPGAARGGRSLTQVVDWAPEDVARWLTEWGLARVAARARAARLRGHALLTAPLVELLARLGLDAAAPEDVHVDVGGLEAEAPAAETRARVRQLLRWLRRAEAAGWAGVRAAGDEEPPDQFLCPITHEVMRDPVLCADGFTYERAALSEWLLGGRFSSPMTNAPLTSTRLRPNAPLRRLIVVWMFGEDADDDEDDEDWPLLSPTLNGTEDSQEHS